MLKPRKTLNTLKKQTLPMSCDGTKKEHFSHKGTKSTED